MGLKLNEYWELNPKQFKKYLDAYQENKKESAKEIDAQNYNLGKYIAIAVNEPKKYPEKPLLWEEKEMTEREMEKVLQNLDKKLKKWQ